MSVGIRQGIQLGRIGIWTVSLMALGPMVSMAQEKPPGEVERRLNNIGANTGTMFYLMGTSRRNLQEQLNNMDNQNAASSPESHGWKETAQGARQFAETMETLNPDLYKGKGKANPAGMMKNAAKTIYSLSKDPTAPSTVPRGPLVAPSAVGPSVAKNSTAPATNGYAVRPIDQQAEFLSKQLGYTGGRLKSDEGADGSVVRNSRLLAIKGDAEFRKSLDQEGYQLLDAIDDRRTGTQAMVVKDTGGQHFIVMRGTEGNAVVWNTSGDHRNNSKTTDWKDVEADLNRDNPGERQYLANQKTLNQWVEKYPDAVVTGHSLGGALGQNLVADRPEKIKEGIFFNAPGISQEKVTQFASRDHDRETLAKVTNFVAKGDPVDAFGSNHLPGRVVLSKQKTQGILHAHGYTMTEGADVQLEEIDYVAYENSRKFGAGVRPGSLHQLAAEDIKWKYHKEAHFAPVAEASHVPADEKKSSPAALPADPLDALANPEPPPLKAKSTVSQSSPEKPPASLATPPADPLDALAATPAASNNPTTPNSTARWVEDSSKVNFSAETEEWIRNNQHQINRAENQQTRDLLKKETDPLAKLQAEAETEALREPSRELIESLQNEANQQLSAERKAAQAKAAQPKPVARATPPPAPAKPAESDAAAQRILAQQQAIANEMANPPPVAAAAPAEGPAPGERTENFFKGVGNVLKTTGKVVGTVAKTGLEVTGAVAQGVSHTMTTGGVNTGSASSPPSSATPNSTPSTLVWSAEGHLIPKANYTPAPLPSVGSDEDWMGRAIENVTSSSTEFCQLGRHVYANNGSNCIRCGAAR